MAGSDNAHLDKGWDHLKKNPVEITYDIEEKTKGKKDRSPETVTVDKLKN